MSNQPAPTVAAFANLKAENSRLLREDVAARRTSYRGLPEVVMVNHSDLCNLRCIMCQRSFGQGQHRLDTRILEHVTQELFPTARKAILTTAGGDPLAVDFDFLLERAQRFGVRLDVVTNGLLLTPDTYRRARHTLDHLNVSLDSHQPAVYERIRAGSSFGRVWRNLEAVAEARLRAPDDVLFSLSVVVMKSNLPHLGEFLRAVAPLRPDGVILQRLLHTEKRTPEEEPTAVFSPAAIDGYLDEAARVARELGLNLFASELRRPNVRSAPPRPKVPMTLEGHGLCWFLTQNFNVMYTGEVFPCCIPTDFCLGDVRYEDPAAIWNGAGYQRLRGEQLRGVGNLFCSGCLHAPHLPPPPDEAQAEVERERRAKGYEAASGLRRAHEDRLRRPIYAPAPPTVVPCDGGFGEASVPVAVTTVAGGIEAATTAGGGLVTLRAGRLEWRAADFTVVRDLDLRAAAGGAFGTAVHVLADGAVLVGFAHAGELLRVAGGEVARVLTLSDPRSFVRNWGITTTADGTVWVGEYGVFPGARCAHLYRSTDGGRSFVPFTRFAEARHIHRVLALADGGLVVTTGDLAAERRLYHRGREGDFVCRSPAWSGFVGALEHDGICHFGTELLTDNALLVYRQGLAAAPELRPLPPGLDLKVRALAAVDGGILVALLGMDENLPQLRAGRRPCLLASHDAGRSWQVVHRFAADWSDEPDDLLWLGGTRLWAIGGAANHRIELGQGGLER